MSNKRLCKRCFGEWKRSPEGRRQRTRHIRKEDASWGKGRWPHELYHDGDGILCVRHQAMHNRKLGQIYERRGVILRQLGFETYAAYLDSELWAGIKERVWTVFGRECHFCGEHATQVHHGDYGAKTMAGESLFALYPICGTCHHQGEFFLSGDKATPMQATRKMKSTAQEAGLAKALKARTARRMAALNTPH